MSVGKEWEIPLRQKTKVLSRDLFLGVVALKPPYRNSLYARLGPFSQVLSHLKEEKIIFSIPKGLICSIIIEAFKVRKKYMYCNMDKAYKKLY